MELQEYHTLFEVEDHHFWFRSLHEHVLTCLKRYLSQLRASSPGRPCHPERSEPKASVDEGSAGRPSAQHDTITILDAGCGTGGLAAKLMTLGEVEAIDSSNLAIEYCKKRGIQNAHQADLNTLTLPENTYDAITCIDVLYHREIHDPASVLRMFQKALKPGGVLFLHLPAYESLRSLHDTRVHTGRRFRMHEAKKLLREAGLEMTHASYRLMFLFLPIVIMRHASSSLRSAQHDRTSDLQRIHSLINTPLLWLSRMENALSRMLPLPFGVSLYAVAKKPHYSITPLL